MKHPVNKNKGQSTLEYLILLGGVVTFFVIFLNQGVAFNRQMAAGHSGALDGVWLASCYQRKAIDPRTVCPQREEAEIIMVNADPR